MSIRSDQTMALAERLAPMLPPGWYLSRAVPSTILDWSRGADVFWVEVDVTFHHTCGIEVEMNLRNPPPPEWLMALLVASETMPAGSSVAITDWPRRA